MSWSIILSNKSANDTPLLIAMCFSWSLFLGSIIVVNLTLFFPNGGLPFFALDFGGVTGVGFISITFDNALLTSWLSGSEGVFSNLFLKEIY